MILPPWYVFKINQVSFAIMMIRTAETAAAVFLLSFPLIPYGQGFSGFIRNDSVRPKGYHPFQFSFRIRRPSVNGNSPLMHCVNQFACKGGIMAVQTVDLIIQFVYILNQISLFTNQFLRLIPGSAPCTTAAMPFITSRTTSSAVIPFAPKPRMITDKAVGTSFTSSSVYSLNGFSRGK